MLFSFVDGLIAFNPIYILFPPFFFRQPQWTEDERICAIQANSEIHFFENGNFGMTLCFCLFVCLFVCFLCICICYKFVLVCTVYIT